MFQRPLKAMLLAAGLAALGGCAQVSTPRPVPPPAAFEQLAGMDEMGESTARKVFEPTVPAARDPQIPPPAQNDREIPARRQPVSTVQVAHQEPLPIVPQPPAELDAKPPQPNAEVVVESGAGSISPGEPGKFTLRQLTEIALQINPILQRSQSEIESAKGERLQAGLYPNPRMETNNPEIFSGQQSFVNVGFQQDIVVKGKIRALKAAADQRVRRETADYQVDRSRMLANIRGQFYQVVAAKQRQVLANYLIKVAEQSVSAAKELQKGGEGSLTDVLLLENELQRAFNERDKAKTMLEGEIRQLEALVGARDLVIADVEGTLFDQPPDFDESGVRNFVSTQSSYMERSQADVVRSQALLRKEEADAYPNLRMGPAYQAGTLPHSSQFWLSVVFDIPVWDLNQGNIRQAAAKVRSAQADLEITRNELLQHAAEIYSRYRSSKQTADRLRNTMLPNSQRTLQLVQEGFTKGQFDVNRLLQAQRNLSDIARDHLDAAEKAWNAAAELGGLLQLEQFGD